MKPYLSFLMTTYNDMRIFPVTVASLQSQAFRDWELLILDNSDGEGPWEQIMKTAAADPRIHAFRSAENVGWAKGTSELLKHANGEYVTFLAADDFLNADSLVDLSRALSETGPDVAFVGNAYVELAEDMSIRILGGVSPEYHIYDNTHRSECIADILSHTYYNSMFHYCRLSFLKTHGIDFYEPFYGDCGGMTEALCRAEKILSYDKAVYLLTMNTSQTHGKYTWNFYRIISGQWKAFKEVFERENYRGEQNIRYVAEKIFDNLVGHIDILMNNGTCRDKCMNPISVTYEQRMLQVKEMLQDPYIADLFNYLGQNRLKAALESRI